MDTKTMKIGSSTVPQLRAGASILAAAQTVDTRLIKPRLVEFEQAFNQFARRHADVGTAENGLLTGEQRFGDLDAAQDQAVDALGRALIADGFDCINPFRSFDAPAPRTLMALAPIAEAAAIHQLAAAIQRRKEASKAALQATAKLDKTASAVEQEVAELERLRAVVREARRARDEAAHAYKKKLGALKRAARAAADSGAPTLYATLFHRPAKPSGKTAKPAPDMTPTATPATPIANPAT